MSNFSPKLQDATDEQLMSMINELDFQVVPLASDELTRRTIKKLEKMIEVFNNKSSKQTERLVQLTRWIVFLTIAMVIGLVVQIYLAKIQTMPILLEQERSERRAYEICKNDPKGEYTGLTGVSIKCSDVFGVLKEKFK